MGKPDGIIIIFVDARLLRLGLGLALAGRSGGGW